MPDASPEAGFEVARDVAGDPLRGTLGRLLARAGRALARWPRAAVIAIVASWMLMIFGLSAQPSTQTSSAPLWSFLFNSGHSLLYGVLALWLSLLLPRRAGWPRLGRAEFLGVLAAILLYGVSDELHQSTVPGRAPSALDLVTDLVGAAATLSVIGYLGRPEASERGLRLRLGLGLLGCTLAGAAATFAPGWFGRPPWF